MPIHVVEIIIENKPAAKDPEGTTIQRDLLNKGGYEQVKSVRTGKYLRVSIEAKDETEALEMTRNFCNDLRIYNPVVHSIDIKIKKD
ncbi:MAG: phosphoribosylformylglycinamidine synthase subunit PurS [Candidatus Helarchaeota archaeon]